MDKPSSTIKVSTPHITPPEVVGFVIDAFIDAKNVSEVERGKPRRFWPENDQIVTYVVNLPADCALIRAAIREYLTTAGPDGYLKFPVKSIRIDRRTGRIRVVGDRTRASEMRPLPKR